MTRSDSAELGSTAVPAPTGGATGATGPGDAAGTGTATGPAATTGPAAIGPTAAAEQGNTTGLAGAPDPRVDSSDQAAARDRAADDRMDRSGVPAGVRSAAAWAWRFVAIAAAAYVLLWIIARIQVVVVPLAVALLISALLQPLAAMIAKRGAPPAVATAITLFSGLIGIGLLVWLVVHQFRNGLGELTGDINGGVDKIRDWLVNGPLGLSQSQIDQAIASGRTSLTENRSTFTSGALGAASTVGHVVAGALLTLFTTIFFVKDGRRIWSWVVRLFPRGSRERVAGAGERAWRTLQSYVHATLAVAFVDAVGIGVGAAVLGVPLALPLAVVVFLGSFVPIIGATLSGLIAVLVALVAKGPVTALILLGVVLAVQQLEGHVLQPLLLGRAVKVHPLAVVLGIATGTLLAGIIGALVAVPIVAVVNTVASYLSAGGAEERRGDAAAVNEPA